jgi:hypothetical protein
MKTYLLALEVEALEALVNAEHQVIGSDHEEIALEPVT